MRVFHLNFDGLKLKIRKWIAFLIFYRINDKDRYINFIFNDLIKEIGKRGQKMPTPLMVGDADLRDLYLEYYKLTLLGFHNASLVAGGILMESVVKHIYLYQTGKVLQTTFDPAIKAIKPFITVQEEKFFMACKDRLRNPFTHSNSQQIVPNVKIRVLEWNVKFRQGIKKETQANHPLFAGVFREEISKTIFFQTFLNIHNALDLLQRRYLSKPKVAIQI